MPAPATTEELLKRVDTRLIYPPFMRKVEVLVANCEARGHRYYAISGYRSVEEQNALFAQGRPGGPAGDIVTKARGGQSAHNFAVAMDFCKDADMDRAGLQPDWKPSQYIVLAEEAEKLGLEAGLHWKFMDAPHIQLRLSDAGLLLFAPKTNPFAKNLLSIHRKKGMAGVFATLDAHQW